jgi:hypothetical protein
MIVAIYPRQKWRFLDVRQPCHVLHLAGQTMGVAVPVGMFDDPSDSAMQLMSELVKETLGVDEPFDEFRTQDGWLQPKRRAPVVRSLSVRFSDKSIAGIVHVIALLGCVESVPVEGYLTACRFTAPSNANFGMPASFDLLFCLRNFTDCHVLASCDRAVVIGGPLAGRLLRAAKRALRASAMATAVRDSS